MKGGFWSRIFPPPPPEDRGPALENFRRVRGLEIRTRKLVNDVFSGEYHSVFRGRGIEFAEVREYQPGDDVRSIDWNVTARTGRPFVKQYQEERELTVVFAVDISGSLGFGTRRSFKSELAAELCAVLGMSALQNNDKMGLMLFSDRVELFLRPRKGRYHALRLIREVLAARATGHATRMEDPLEQLRRVLKRKTILFLVSDFLGPVPVKQISLLNRHHDVVALHLTDPAEQDFPRVGLVELRDAETGRRAVVDTGSPGLLRRYREDQRRRLDEVKASLARAKVEVVTLSTAESFVRPLMDFFQRRAR